MLNQQILHPESIVVVGASNNLHKPGGKLLKNLREGTFQGKLFAVNPNEGEIQGVDTLADISLLPPVQLAILAVPARFCPEIMRRLASEKQTRAFIVISAGFSEEGEPGLALENQLLAIACQYDACLIGPNCIGVLTSHYQGVFTSPIPRLNASGCDLISGSGATAVFILESGLPKGLSFASVWSVGNSAQTGVEDILAYMDQNYTPSQSAPVKLLYIESIKDPDKLLLHATSLIQKGCRIAAIKSGGSEAGKRAASSHTGALATSDLAVDALFRKAGIVRCQGREELVTVASVFMYPPLRGNNIAVITQAGGPAVMLTDALSLGGMNVPAIEGEKAQELARALHPGASVANPFDLLATGTAAQLALVIDYCNTHFENIDAMMVIFGSPGLDTVFDAYQVLHEKMQGAPKPIFPILPSLHTAKDEVAFFLSKNHINFPDEVNLGLALTKVFRTHRPDNAPPDQLSGFDLEKVRRIIGNATSGYLPQPMIQELLDATGIPRVNEFIASRKEETIQIADRIGFPLVMKTLGPIHKTEVDGVVLNINTWERLFSEFDRMMSIPQTTAVLLQPMLKGRELFVGASYEPDFGHIILFGLGGIFVEILGDISSGLAPLSYEEAFSMIRSIKSYRIIEGARGKEGVNTDLLADILVRLSFMLRHCTEIKELDLNPLIGTPDAVHVVDARIRVDV